MHPRLIVPAIAIFAAAGLSAQTLTGLQADPITKLGQPASVTADFDAADNINCGIRIDWGDGSGNDFKITSRANIPLKATHAYAAAGNYTVTAEPKRVTTHLGCIGKKKTALVRVVTEPKPAATAPAAAPKPMPQAMAAPSSCPADWKLNPKSVNKKTGAYTCTAKAGTPVAGNKVSCPGDLTYFENSKKGQLGCRP